jgi:hypothetical protein
MQTINLSRDDAEDELKYLLDVVLPPFGSMVKDLNIYDGDCGDNVCGAGYTLKGPYGKAVESLVAQLMDGLYHLTSLSMGYVPSLSRPYGHFASLAELSFNIANPDTSDLTAIILSSPNLVELCINIQWTISSKRSLFAAAIASREKLSILHLVGPTDYFTREFAEAEWKCPLATLWIGHQPTWYPTMTHPLFHTFLSNFSSTLLHLAFTLTTAEDPGATGANHRTHDLPHLVTLSITHWDVGTSLVLLYHLFSKSPLETINLFDADFDKTELRSQIDRVYGAHAGTLRVIRLWSHSLERQDSLEDVELEQYIQGLGLEVVRGRWGVDDVL